MPRSKTGCPRTPPPRPPRTRKKKTARAADRSADRRWLASRLQHSPPVAASSLANARAERRWKKCNSGAVYLELTFAMTTRGNTEANVKSTAPALIEDGRAKVNLTLRVVGRRVDGYHDLESVVAFADCADRLSLTPGSELHLVTTGPLAHACGETSDNLVLKAARLLGERVP